MTQNKYEVRGKLYFDIGDYINEVLFKIKIPTYALMLPKVVEENYFVPSFISNMNKFTESITVSTIADLIEYRAKSIPFKILKNEDALKIYEIMIDYVESLKSSNNISNQVKAYIQKAIKFKDSLKETLDKLSHTDINLKNKLKKEKSIGDILSSYA